MIISDVISNVAVLALISLFSGFVVKRCAEVRRVAVFQGLLFGCACVAGMLCPAFLAPGLHYDGRAVMLSLCGLFFGPLAAGVAGGVALFGQFVQGADGWIVGVLTIVFSVLLGLVFRFRRSNPYAEPSPCRLVCLGLSAHVCVLLSLCVLPGGLAFDTLRQIVLPVLLIGPLATLLIGKVLSDQMARERLLGDIREREERFRTTLYSVGEGLITTDVAGFVCQLNPAAERLTGWTEAEAQGRPCGEVFHLLDEETRQVVENPVERVIRTGADVELPDHVLLISRDGTEYPVADSGSPIRNAAGEVTGVVLVFHDQIVERAVQKALRDSEAGIRAVFENAPVGFFTTTSEGLFRVLNGTMARMVGFSSPEEALKKDLHVKNQLGVSPEQWDKLLDALMAEGRVKAFEVEVKTYSATKAWLSINARVTERQADGSFMIEGFASDITGRKKTELQMARTANRVSVLLRILQYSTQDIRELFNYALEEVIKITGSKIGYVMYYGKDNKNLVLSVWSENVVKACQARELGISPELSKTGMWEEAVRQHTAVIINDFTADNPLGAGVPLGHVSVSKFLSVPILQAGQVIGVVGIANKEADYDQEDVMQVQILMGGAWKEAERKRSEEARELLEEQLHQAQKMEAIGRLAGGVAHDFNNILQAMMGYSELLLESVPDQNHFHELIREILSEGKRAATLTNQLLAFARKQTIMLKVIDLNESVTAMLKMLRRLLGEDIELCWKPAAGLWPVKMDPGQVDQILANLAVNARDAIKGVGTMTIETAKVTFDADYCQSHVGVAPGDYVMLAVSDNGIGMDKQVQSQIFEPFFTTKQRDKGTGLGLSTVYGIVKQNKGTINVYSELEHGTTFKIYLPPCQEAIVEEEKPAQSVESLPGGAETVLIVDDEEALLRAGKLILGSLGYHVLAASDPEDAIRQSQAYPGVIHVLLTDVVMPKLSGRELLQRLSVLRPDMKSIYMSGYTANVIAHHGVLDSGIHFLQKPFSRKELAAKIREVVEGLEPGDQGAEPSEP